MRGRRQPAEILVTRPATVTSKQGKCMRIILFRFKNSEILCKPLYGDMSIQKKNANSFYSLVEPFAK